MLNLPPKEVLNQIPRLQANEKARTSIGNIVIHLHLFAAVYDWWIAEFDGVDLFWGFVNLGDNDMAKWDCTSYVELKSICNGVLVMQVVNAHTEKIIDYLPPMIEWDENWKPKPFREVKWRK